MNSIEVRIELEVEVKEGLKILILGGLNSDLTKNLINYFITINNKNNKEIKFIKLVDKFLILPELNIINCYLDDNTKNNLLEGIKKGLIEYEQLNLLLELSQIKAFTLPIIYQTSTTTNNNSYDIVYDLTTSSINTEILNLPLQNQLERTLKLTLSLGNLAASNKVSSYTKLLTPFYKNSNTKKGKVGKVEGEEGKGEEECWGVISKLLNESVRGLSLIKGLNLIVIRPGIIYGGVTLEGITPRILIAQLYSNTPESLDFLWSPSLQQSTIHILDLCQALYSTSLWSLEKGRNEALRLAGEVLSYSLSGGGGGGKEDEIIKEGLKGLKVEGMAGKEEKTRVVLFNVVDEGDTKLGDIASVIGTAVGIKIGFQNSLISTMAKLNLKDAVEDINDKHQELFNSVTSSSSSNIQISPIIPSEYLQPYPISLSSSKITRILEGKWKAERKLDVECIRETIEGFKNEGGWLVADEGKGEGGKKGKGKK